MRPRPVSCSSRPRGAAVTVSFITAGDDYHRSPRVATVEPSVIATRRVLRELQQSRQQQSPASEISRVRRRRFDTPRTGKLVHVPRGSAARELAYTTDD